MYPYSIWFADNILFVKWSNKTHDGKEQRVTNESLAS